MVKEHRHSYSGTVVVPKFKLFRRPVSPINSYATVVTKMDTGSFLHDASIVLSSLHSKNELSAHSASTNTSPFRTVQGYPGVKQKADLSGTRFSMLGRGSVS